MKKILALLVVILVVVFAVNNDITIPAIEDINISSIINNATSSIIEDITQGNSQDNTQDVTENNDGLIKCKLVRVVDGDTLVITLPTGVEIKARLIGVNTPESVHADESKNTVEGDIASAFTKSILSEYEYVYIELDVGTYDKYGRLLCYVYLDELKNVMLNKLLISEGYAEPMTIEPNTKYAAEFEALQRLK